MAYLIRPFKALLEMLRSELSAIKEALGENKRAIDAASVCQQNAGSGIERKIAEMRPDDEYKRGAHTYKHKAYWQQVASNILTAVLTAATIGAFLAAAYYACIAKRQLGQMITANQVTRCATLVSAQSAAENAYYSREEERAWVELQMGTGPGFISLGNPGKTVAREVRLSVDSATGTNRFGPMTISPYTQSPVPFIYSVPKQHRVKGRITYVDVFGVSHWATFCYTLSEKGAMNHCASGNDEDYNLENPPKSSVPNSCKQ